MTKVGLATLCLGLMLQSQPVVSATEAAVAQTAVPAANVISLSQNADVEKLAEDLEQTKQSLINDEIRQRQVMSALFDINRKMKKIVTERSDLVQERLMLEGTTKKLAESVLSLDTQLKQQKTKLRDRLSTIYKFGGQGVARFIFSSASSAQLERNLKILGIVAKQDLDLIKGYSRTVRELENKRNKFTQRLAHLRKVEGRILDQETQLSAENSQKNKILDKIRKSKKFTMSKLSNLREKSNRYVSDDTGVFDLLFRPSFFEQKGQLSAPIQGQVIQPFGLIKDEEHSVVLTHKGVFYAAPVGTAVKAVFDGRVSYIGNISGFGQTIILDHGDHYYSVYSHNGKVQIDVNDEVQKHQVIALSGNTNVDLGPGLYFEIRHFSEPYDPKSWMKGSKL